LGWVDGGIAQGVAGAYLVGQRPLAGTHWRAGTLDGILLGTASAVSFTLVETLGQYVPEMIRNGSLEAGAVSVGWWVCSCCFREF